MSMRPWSTSCVAIRNAAAAVAEEALHVYLRFLP
jgi:hypothetical protein